MKTHLNTYLNTNRNLILSVIICLLFPMLLPACGRSEEIAYTKTDFYFDTVVTLTVYDTPSHREKAEAILQDGMEACKNYDALFDPNNEESDLYRINHAGGEWTHVSEDTVSVLYAALEFCKITGGAIDITIQPAYELWDFSGNDDHIPPDDRMQKALSHVDYDTIRIEGSKVMLTDPEAAITLGFIAKGYIADKVKESMIQAGARNAIINLGGNVQTIGDKADHSGYSVGIQKPFGDMGEYVKSVTAGERDDLPGAVVTSGTYERCFTLSDKLYHHILDPATGMPVKTDLSSVTILADSAMEADALSTTCLIMGSEEAKSYIESLEDISAVLIKEDGTLIEVN